MNSARYPAGGFVERRWLTDEVIRFRDDAQRRHLIIVGEPGSGKSAFVAHLAETWKCPHHFIRVDSRVGATGLSARVFLISIGKQMAQRYGPGIFEPLERSARVQAV